jgi:hypothetical protein
MFSTGAKVDGAASKSWWPKIGRRCPVEASMNCWNSLRSAAGCAAGFCGSATAAGFAGSGQAGRCGGQVGDGRGLDRRELQLRSLRCRSGRGERGCRLRLGKLRVRGGGRCAGYEKRTEECSRELHQASALSLIFRTVLPG